MRLEVDEGYEDLSPSGSVEAVNGNRLKSAYSVKLPCDFPLPQRLDDSRPNWNLSPIKSKKVCSSRTYPEEREFNGRRTITEGCEQSTHPRSRLSTEVKRLGEIIHRKELEAKNNNKMRKHRRRINSSDSTQFSFNDYSERLDNEWRECDQETARGRLESGSSHPENAHFVEKMMDLTLDEIIYNGRRSPQYKDEAVQTEKNCGRRRPVTREEVPLETVTLDYPTNCASLQRFEVPTQMRAQFSYGLLDGYLSHNGVPAKPYTQGKESSKSVSRHLMQTGPGRSRRHSIDIVRSTSKAPFCSTGSGVLTHSIYANEQQVMNLVNQRFPHWRVLVKQLFNDGSTRTSAALHFLTELENRKRIAERSEEWRRDDEKVLRTLRGSLANGGTSQIQQLRIMYNSLNDAL